MQSSTKLINLRDFRLWFMVFASIWVIPAPLGCNDTPPPPPDLIPEQLYIRVLAESAILDAFEKYYGDSLRILEMRNYILDSLGVTKDQIDRSHQWYNLEPEKQRSRYRAVKKILETELDSMKADVSRRRIEN